MKTIQDYLSHADECEKLARNARSADERKMITDMAETWRMLAQQRRIKLEKKRTTALGPYWDLAETRANDFDPFSE